MTATLRGAALDGAAQETDSWSKEHRRPEPASFSAEWRGSYGSTWWVDLACLGAVIFILGALQPLSDPDLPMHLATGEWIARHRAVPFVEPFAWTRAGQPYFAYSWALELAYYFTLRWFGVFGLHMLEGVTLVLSAASMLLLGHTARWRPWVTFCMSALNVGLAILVVPSLRPQLVLFTLIPLAWACTYRMLYAPRIRWAFVGACAVSAAAANSHLFFVLTAAPISLIVASPPRDRHRTWTVCAAPVIGWLCSPYAVVWPAVFRLNFGYNALLAQPSPIKEFHPGFRPGIWLLFVLPLALIPWIIDSSSLRRRERLVYGALWFAGLVAFGYAGRLLLCWWLIILPVAALAIDNLGANGRVAPPRKVVKLATYATAITTLVTVAIVMLPYWRAEGDISSRRLPTEGGASIEPLLAWLHCNVDADAAGRIYTWFNYGSYLVWRLPRFSASIDGRTIFPDSVAKPEALRSGLLPLPRSSVWKSADLAIIPRSFAVASDIDSSTDWKLVAAVYEAGHPDNAVGLWTRRAWWEAEGKTPLSTKAEMLTTSPDSPRTDACAATR